MKDRRLLSGITVAILGLFLNLGFSQLGINVDINPLEDQVLTLFEAMEIIGLALIALANKTAEAVKAEVGK